MGIAFRRIRRIPRDRAAVEDACEHGDAVRHLHPSANAQGRERIGRAAARQIYCWNPRPAGHRAKEECVRGWGNGEFLIEALLADLDVEFVAEFLLIPELPKPNADGRLDIGEGLQSHEIVRGQITAPNLKAAHVERAALKTERFRRVHLQRHGGQAIRLEALFDPTAEIPECLDVLEYGQRYPGVARGGPQAPHVAEQVRAVPGDARETERRRASWRRGRALRGRGGGGRSRIWNGR